MVSWNYPDDTQLFAGVNIPIEGLGITMRTPTAKEILMLGERKYLIALQILEMNKKHLNIDSIEITDWMIFNRAMNEKIEGIRDTRILLQNFLSLFFTNHIVIGPNSIIVQENDKIVNIEPEDFPAFQKIIDRLACGFLFQVKEEKFNPKNKLAAQIAEKMKKARAKLARVKAAEQGTINKAERGLLWRYLKFVTTATPNTMRDAVEMTLFQLHILTETGLSREAYELDVKSCLAGAKNDKPLEHWLTKDLDLDDNIGTI